MRFWIARMRCAAPGEVTHRIVQGLRARRVSHKLKRLGAEAVPCRVDEETLEALQLPGVYGEEGDPPPRDLGGAQEGGADVRLLWEPARLQEAIRLLFPPDGRPGPREGGTARDLVLRWLRENPFSSGIHYRSAMECALRIPVFFFCLKKISGLSPADRSRLVDAVRVHGWWTVHRLSLFSSRGNHTVAEAVGLVFAGALCSKDPEGRRWLEQGIALLHQEVEHQILEDGGPAEQSLGYHRFVVDLYWLAADFLERNRLHDCRAWRGRLERAEDFLGCFAYAPGRFPAIGDGDDGRALGPGLRPARRRSEGTGGAGEPDSWEAVGGDEGLRYRTFHASGYTVIRNAKRDLLTFDHGPLGMAPLYNHGHADALAVTLAREGVPVLVDPGTYRYNGVPSWRRYFKGTSAHNTVTVDERDQAVQATSFIWTRPFHARLVRCETDRGALVLEAQHDGYRRIDPPVIHQRRVRWEGHIILIQDVFHGEGAHRFSLHYHLHPECEVEHDDGWWRARRGSVELFLRVLGNIPLQYSKGLEDPILGWYSRAYGHREPCPVLHAAVRGDARKTRFLTAIGLGRRPDVGDVAKLGERL